MKQKEVFGWQMLDCGKKSAAEPPATAMRYDIESQEVAEKHATTPESRI